MPSDDTSVAAYDAQVKLAWIRRMLSDGTKLDLGMTDHEQMFAVTQTGTFAVIATRSGWQRCEDGSQDRVTVTNIAGIIPNAGGHTHPLGRASDFRADMPGPEDGYMAFATGKAAYVISRRRAFAIEVGQGGDFHTRILAGTPFGRAEQAELAKLEKGWKLNRGGSGLKCQFTPG